MKRMNFIVLAGITMLALSSGASAVEIMIGDYDGFGFSDVEKLVGADGKKADRNKDGILGKRDVLPDQNGSGTMQSGHGDDFDHRSEKERNAKNGAQWTDISLSKSYRKEMKNNELDVKNVEFVFTFAPPAKPAPGEVSYDYNKPHYVSFVYSDYDANNMKAIVEGKELQLKGVKDMMKKKGSKKSKYDGFIWRAYTKIKWKDIQDGKVKVTFNAENEPYVAFDYALLDLQPISPPPPPLEICGQIPDEDGEYYIIPSDYAEKYIDKQKLEAYQILRIDEHACTTSCN